MLLISSFPIIYSLAGSRNKDLKPLVPQLVGAVWEACTALKKTPASNITAIGRAMTQVAVSVKDDWASNDTGCSFSEGCSSRDGGAQASILQSDRRSF
jgi:hypothetical protein